MDISVVIPIYNVERFVERSVRSLFTQTKVDGVEFIFVNDSSSDNSISIVQRLISEFPHLNTRIIDHPQNMGLAVARQTGLDAAVGEYILSFDSDDWAEPNMLEHMYSQAEDSGADIVGCGFYYTYLDREVVAHRDMLDGDYCPSDGVKCVSMILSGRLYTNIWARLIRRSLFSENGIGWTPGIDLGEDFLIISKLFFFAKTIIYIPKPYVHYVQRLGSITKQVNEKYLNDRTAIVEELESFFRHHNALEQLKKPLIVRKSYLKIDLLRLHSLSDRSKLYNIYPELSGYRYLLKSGLDMPRAIILSVTSQGSMLWIYSIVNNFVCLYRMVRMGCKNNYYI